MHRLVLTPDQRQERVVLRDTAPKPYLQERSAALLKIADGRSATEVARSGLLRPRTPTTVWRWLVRYRAEGIAGLHGRSGRRRKPACSPLAPRSSGGPDGAARRGRQRRRRLSLLLQS